MAEPLEAPAAPRPLAARAAVRARGLERTFGSGDLAVHALRDVDLDVAAGELVVILGPSGSGKTTLLNLLGAIDEPTAGDIVVDGVDLARLDADGRTGFRRDHVGFVFQFFNLIPTLTALENVSLVGELTGHGDETTALDALAAVGLASRAASFPAQLSGGEQQRVAIARAVAKDPPVLLADEPTGALDLETGRQVLDVLRSLNRSRGMTLLCVTHNAVIGRMADRVLRLRDGRIVENVANDAPVEASELDW